MTDDLHDQRRPPFCYQTHAALDAIRAAGGRASAIAVYVAMTETANREGGATARRGFTALRAEIADRAGLSVDTLDRHVPTLEAAGVLIAEKRTEGNLHLPTTWTLIEPPPQNAPRGRVVRSPLPHGAVITRVPSPEPKKDVEGTPLMPPAMRDLVASASAAWSAHAPPLIEHRESYYRDAKLHRKLKAAVDRYGVDDVCAAIAAYAHALASPEHYWNHRWTLADFLTRGLDRFVPEALPLDNFRRRQGGTSTGLSPGEIAQLGGDDL